MYYDVVLVPSFFLSFWAVSFFLQQRTTRMNFLNPIIEHSLDNRYKTRNDGLAIVIASRRGHRKSWPRLFCQTFYSRCPYSFDFDIRKLNDLVHQQPLDNDQLVETEGMMIHTNTLSSIFGLITRMSLSFCSVNSDGTFPSHTTPRRDDLQGHWGSRLVLHLSSSNVPLRVILGSFGSISDGARIRVGWKFCLSISKHPINMLFCGPKACSVHQCLTWSNIHRDEDMDGWTDVLVVGMTY